MLKNKRCFSTIFLFFALLVFLSSINAYEIIGGCVVQDNANYKLEVCPHTAYSPTGKNYEQTFTLTNKSDQNFLNNVWVAYKFDDPLIGGKVERFRPTVFDWVSYTAYCPMDANTLVRLDMFGGINPHYGECYYNFQDLNGMDVNSFLFQKQFYDYNNSERTIDYYVWEATQVPRWNNVTSLFDFQDHLNDAVYYTNVAGSFPAGHSETWRLDYSPSLDSQNKKWELAIYADSDNQCIFTDTCVASLWLDPWYSDGTNWTWKMRYDFNGYTGASAVNNFGLLMDVNSDHSDFWANVAADGADVRVLNCAENTLYNYGFEDFNTVTQQAYIWADVNMANAADCAYLYWGNGDASAVADINGAFPTTKYGAVFLWSPYLGILQDATLNDNDLDLNGTPTTMLTGGLPATAANDLNDTDYYTHSAIGMPTGNDSRTLIQAIRKDTDFAGTEFNAYGATTGLEGSSQVFALGMNKGATNDIGQINFVGYDNDLVCTGTDILDGDWHVEVANFKGGDSGDANVLTLYADGVAQCSAAKSLFTVTTSTTSAIGKLSYSAQGEDVNVDSVFWIDQNVSSDEVLAWSLNLHGSLGAFEAAEENLLDIDLNIVAPNTLYKIVSGTSTFDFNFFEQDFNSFGDYNYSIQVYDINNLIYTNIVTDRNAFTDCSNMDGNTTIKECSFSYNFSANLNPDTNYLWDMNLSNLSQTATDTADFNFIIQNVSIDVNIFSRLKLGDLDEDGINFGEESEAWIAEESKSKTLDAINVDSNQILIIKTLNDNTTFEIFVNSISIGTKDANAADPQVFQYYAYEIDSSRITGNPQTIRLDAGSGQSTTYVDWIAWMDVNSSDFVEGGQSVGMLFDVNGFGGALTEYYMNIDQNETITRTDANIVGLGKGKYLSVLKIVDSLNTSVNAWAEAVVDSVTYSGDVNSTIEIDSINPVINSLTMELDVIVGDSITFDSNTTELNFKNAVLTIEGTDYDLNAEIISSNDYNAYDPFIFVVDGNYAASLAVFDQVDQNATFAFTIKASDFNATQASEDQNTNWLRASAIDVNVTRGYLDSTFRMVQTYAATGTANIDYYDFDYSLLNGHQEDELRGSVKNVQLLRENKSAVSLGPLIDQNTMRASDVNGTVTIIDYITYDLNGNIEVEWSNTGAEDKRLIYVNSTDHNTALTDFWIKVELRTTYNASNFKLTFKNCVSGINFGAGTCSSYETIDIYDQADGTYNGGTFPTEDSDSDDLKDVIYFKVPTLSEHMFLLDLTASAEPTWAEGTESGPGNSDGGPGPDGVIPDSEAEEVTLTDAGVFGDFFSFITGLFGPVGEFFGGLLGGLGFQFERVVAQNLFAPENVFTIVSIIMLAIVFFILIPQAEQRTKIKGFGVKV